MIRFVQQKNDERCRPRRLNLHRGEGRRDAECDAHRHQAADAIGQPAEADGAKEHALRREPLKPGEERGPRLMHPKDVRYEKAEQDAKHICDEQKTRER